MANWVSESQTVIDEQEVYEVSKPGEKVKVIAKAPTLWETLRRKHPQLRIVRDIDEGLQNPYLYDLFAAYPEDGFTDIFVSPGPPDIKIDWVMHGEEGTHTFKEEDTKTNQSILAKDAELIARGHRSIADSSEYCKTEFPKLLERQRRERKEYTIKIPKGYILAPKQKAKIDAFVKQLIKGVGDPEPQVALRKVSA